MESVNNNVTDDEEGLTLLTLECHAVVFISNKKKGWTAVSADADNFKRISKDTELGVLKKHFQTICSREVNQFGELVKEAEKNRRKDTKCTVYISHNKNYTKAVGKRVDLNEETLEVFLQACAKSTNKVARIRFDMTNPIARKVNERKVGLCWPLYIHWLLSILTPANVLLMTLFCSRRKLCNGSVRCFKIRKGAVFILQDNLASLAVAGLALPQGPM